MVERGQAEPRMACGKGIMRKKKKLEKGTEARRRARASGVAPAGTRVIADKRKKPEKHKRRWLEQESA